MYKAASGTRIIGNNLIYSEEVVSTNSWALEFSKNKEIKDGTVFITDHQTQGRGQMGNRWQSDPKLNLTFSVVLNNPVNLKEQFYLNVFITLAIHSFLSKHLNKVNIKWPNDILVGNRKIAGVLIENLVRGSRITTSIVGIGLNVNQQHFKLASATSLRNESGKEMDLQVVLEELLKALDEKYDLLQSTDKKGLLNNWYEHLYLSGQPHIFTAGENSFEGVISGVDDGGRLLIQTVHGLKHFGIKEVSY